MIKKIHHTKKEFKKLFNIEFIRNWKIYTIFKKLKYKLS